MDIIENKKFDLERSLYNLKDTKVIKCIFKGINDGESVLKEAKNIEVLCLRPLLLQLPYLCRKARRKVRNNKRHDQPNLPYRTSCEGACA